MSKTLYLECYSGISGDMTVAALLDLGADRAVLDKALKSIPAGGFTTKITRKSLSGIDACDFDVILDKEHENHDHDMEYLFGKDHHHDHEYHGEHHHHHHEHRNLHDILHIISHVDMTDGAKDIANRIFTIIAEAESRAHGLPVEEVHFHEVGAIDSIVDIVAVAVCLDNLDVKKVYVPKVYEGRGFVRCQHGEIPIPVPAVTNITAAHGITLHVTDMEAELVTPTGAAILAAIKTNEELPEAFAIEKIGIGAGKRAYKRPSMLRAMLIQEKEGKKDSIVKMETNIDDCTGEQLGYTMEKLLEAGALDVYYTPIYMKKNRPAYCLSVLCKEEMAESLEFILFKETTTIGIRKCVMQRSVLQREAGVVDTSYGEVKVKTVTLPDGEVRNYPEYESVAKVSREKEVSFRKVYKEAGK